MDLDRKPVLCKTSEAGWKLTAVAYIDVLKLAFQGHLVFKNAIFKFN